MIILFFFLLAAEINGLLPPPVLSVSLTQGIAFAIGAVWTIVLVNLATRNIDESLALAQRELSEHHRADERARYRSAILEKVIQLGKTVTEVADFQTTLLRIWKGVRSELDFDRSAIFLYSSAENLMEGTYGTDRDGNLSEIWGRKFSLIPDDPFFQLLSRPDGLLFTHDFRDELHHEPSAGMVGVKEHVSVAVWAGEKPVAIITADQLLTNRLITEEQLEALRLFAGYAGLAIENARLGERERSRQEMLEKVIRLGKAVTEEADYRTVLLRIWNGIRDELGFDRVGIFTYDAIRDTVRGSYGTDRNGNLIEEWQLDIPAWVSDFFGGVLRRPDSFYFTSDYEKGRNLPPEDIMWGVKYYAAVSAWANEKPVAIICVDQLVSGRQITEEQLEGLRFFAGYAGFAIENTRLGERERSRQAMLEKVIRLGKVVTQTSDFQKTLVKICEGVRNDLGLDRVGLFLYNPVEGMMMGAYGTDRAGKLFEASHVKLQLRKHELFADLLENPDGFYFTRDYQGEQQLPADNEMSAVKYYAAIAVRAGDKPIAIISVDQLITDRVISEEQLEGLRLFAGYAGLAIENARLNSDLELRVVQRTAQLEAANRDLESFSYSISHDLRAPLRAINGFSRILNDDFSTQLSPRAQEYLKKIGDSGEKMAHLIADLLDFSRLGRKPLVSQPVDITSIVRSVLETLALETADRQIEWILSELPVVNADPVLIQQVYANLIGNAIKYTRNREQAQIEIGSLNHPEEVVLFVRDNGAGFDMQFANKLFGVFQRLHREDEFEGTGIGLATVQRIIQRHGGRVWAEAKVDQGATFYFSLPR